MYVKLMTLPTHSAVVLCLQTGTTDLISALQLCKPNIHTYHKNTAAA